MPLTPTVYYIHGFNSSPQSHKAQLIGWRMQQIGLAHNYRVPLLSYNPRKNIAMLENQIQADGVGAVTLIGSSMGGFYCAYLSQKWNVKAVLVNPVVDAYDLLKDHLGNLKNDYTNETYDMSEADLEYYRRLAIPRIEHPSRLLVMVQTGDEVLDYQLAVAHYQQCQLIVQPGGTHGFDHFEKMIPTIFTFLGVHDSLPSNQH